MTHSVFKIGDTVAATVGNSEGLPSGSLHKIIEVCGTPHLYWIEHRGKRHIVIHHPDNEQYSGDIRTAPPVVPVVAPVDLMSPTELVQHQQDVVVEALTKWCGSAIGAMKPKPTVVGGAARDWDYNIPAQDIDIWVKNSKFGEDDLKTLKELFEPLGATVGQVTNNTYARDGEYIHYIFNVMWQGVDLQFIFVEDSSVQAVVDHVCCNFSEISWDWSSRMLHPTYVYKAGRKARTLVFRDDKGRSPRECYMDKMAKRYPDHAVIRPGDDCPWESLEPKKQHVNFLEGEWKTEPFPEPKKLYVEALETNEPNKITRGQHYEVLSDDGKFWNIVDDVGVKGGVYKTRFKVVGSKPEVTRRADQVAPDGYTKCIVKNLDGEYWKARGTGATTDRGKAYVFTGNPDAGNQYLTLIWIE